MVNSAKILFYKSRHKFQRLVIGSKFEHLASGPIGRTLNKKKIASSRDFYQILGLAS